MGILAILFSAAVALSATLTFDDQIYLTRLSLDIESRGLPVLGRKLPANSIVQKMGETLGNDFYFFKVKVVGTTGEETFYGEYKMNKRIFRSSASEEIDGKWQFRLGETKTHYIFREVDKKGVFIGPEKYIKKEYYLAFKGRKNQAIWDKVNWYIKDNYRLAQNCEGRETAPKEETEVTRIEDIDQTGDRLYSMIKSLQLQLPGKKDLQFELTKEQWRKLRLRERQEGPSWAHNVQFTDQQNNPVQLVVRREELSVASQKKLDKANGGKKVTAVIFPPQTAFLLGNDSFAIGHTGLVQSPERVARKGGDELVATYKVVTDELIPEKPARVFTAEVDAGEFSDMPELGLVPGSNFPRVNCDKVPATASGKLCLPVNFKLVLDAGHTDNRTNATVNESSRRSGKQKNLHEGMMNMATTMIAKKILNQCVEEDVLSDDNVKLSRWPGESYLGEFEQGGDITGLFSSDAKTDKTIKTLLDKAHSRRQKHIAELIDYDYSNSALISIHANGGKGSRVESFIDLRENPSHKRGHEKYDYLKDHNTSYTFAANITSEIVDQTMKYYSKNEKELMKVVLEKEKGTEKGSRVRIFANRYEIDKKTKKKVLTDRNFVMGMVNHKNYTDGGKGPSSKFKRTLVECYYMDGYMAVNALNVEMGKSQECTSPPEKLMCTYDFSFAFTPLNKPKKGSGKLKNGKIESNFKVTPLHVDAAIGIVNGFAKSYPCDEEV